MKKDNSLFIVVGGPSEVGTQFIERCFRKMPNSYFFFTGIASKIFEIFWIFFTFRPKIATPERDPGGISGQDFDALQVRFYNK